MIFSIPKSEKNDILFWSAYMIYLMVSILNTSFYSRYFIVPMHYIYYFCLLLLVAQEIFQLKVTRKAFFSALIGLLLSLALLITTDRVIPIINIFMFAYVGRKQSFEKIIRITLWISIPLVTFIIMSSYLGIIENYVQITNRSLRYYLGFRYVLYAPAYLLNISMLIVYYYRERIKWKYIVAIFLLSTWMYVETVGRLSYYLSLALIFIAIIFKFKPSLLNKRRLLCYLMVVSILICGIFSMYITITYDSSSIWQKSLNSFLSNRLGYGKASWFKYGASVFGQKITWIGNGLDAMGELSRNIQNYNYVDNLYLQIIQQYGIVFIVLFFALNTYSAAYYYRRRDYYMLICLTFLSVHMMIDDLTFYLHYNTFWFAIGFSIFKFEANREMRSTNTSKYISRID